LETRTSLEYPLSTARAPTTDTHTRHIRQTSSLVTHTRPPRDALDSRRDLSHRTARVRHNVSAPHAMADSVHLSRPVPHVRCGRLVRPRRLPRAWAQRRGKDLALHPVADRLHPVADRHVCGEQVVRRQLRHEDDGTACTGAPTRSRLSKASPSRGGTASLATAAKRRP
jgi:hypothetical protein